MAMKHEYRVLWLGEVHFADGKAEHDLNALGEDGYKLIQALSFADGMTSHHSRTGSPTGPTDYVFTNGAQGR